MATVFATSIKVGSLVTRTHCNNQLTGRISGVKFNYASETKNGFPSLRASRFTISCNASPETIQKVCGIAQNQLALPAKFVLTPQSKFSALGVNYEEMLTGRISRVKFASASEKNGFPSLRASLFTSSCNTRQENLDRLCKVVKRVLDLPHNKDIALESTFHALGANSMIMGDLESALREHFRISLDEGSLLTKTTIQEASDMIQKLLDKKESTKPKTP